MGEREERGARGVRSMEESALVGQVICGESGKMTRHGSVVGILKVEGEGDGASRRGG